jgi:site-specific DNA-methyltransferase (adenine-specific)
MALRKLGYKECDVIVASGLTEEQKKKYRLYDNKTGEFATWDQKKLSEELTDVDFQGYDFGQPVISSPDEETGDDGSRTKTCPCCGEVFKI